MRSVPLSVNHRWLSGPSVILCGKEPSVGRMAVSSMVLGFSGGLKRYFLGRDDVKRLLPKREQTVASATLMPTEAARRLLGTLDDPRNR